MIIYNPVGNFSQRASIPLSFLPLAEAGIKAALQKSGAYPYEFGLAVAALIPNRTRRLPADAFSPGDYQGEDHLASLDDLLKSRAQTWWRHL